MNKNRTHVWVRTDVVQAVVDNGGTLPRGWTPSRKRSRGSNKLSWAWARAYIVPQTVPPSTEKEDDNNNSPFGHVKLRKVRDSPISTTTRNQQQRHDGPHWSQNVPVTVTIQKDEFAPSQLHNVTVTLPNYDAIQMANTWWISEKPPDDLCSLTHLHEPAVVSCLKRRYEHDAIYTWTGKILLALNPFRPCPNLYGDRIMQIYSTASAGERPPPHVYAIAQDAYSCMLDSAKNQSILVSGESGAGKTVTTKIIMQYLATLSRKHLSSSESGDIESQVLQSNPILESFGNARTVRNDNSSRFGKFIEISFCPKGSLVSASITTYLLEKVRLISQAPGERNFHVFYELLAGISQKERASLKIANVTCRDFRILSGVLERRDGVEDRTCFRELQSALNTVGFTHSEQHDLFTVVCALLHASNLDFVPDQASSCRLNASNKSLNSTLSLLGVSAENLEKALCSIAIEARGEVLYKHLTETQATKALEALIKATYGALFTHVVSRVNSSITVRDDGASESTATKTAYIGVLDIFGFESFDVNSFEQLCINYCNEALQQQFNRFVFKLEQEEYEREGIEWSFISFPDNQDILDLIEDKRTGILSILDEQCRLRSCTDTTFSRATYEQCCSHDRFTATNSQKVQGAFSIHHYAGLVEYHTTNFLEKNKDDLPMETTELLRSSENPFIVHLGKLLRNPPDAPSPEKQSAPLPVRRLQRTSSSLMRQSVASQFASQLQQLRDRIQQTTPHYVRCLKPNDDLLPNGFHPLVIADQLQCAGVLEVIRVSRVGFPQRFSHRDFLQRYHMLAARQPKRPRLQRKDSCDVLVKHASTLVLQMQHDKHGQRSNDGDELDLGIQMGHSKVFLRQHAFDMLEILRSRRMEAGAIRIQSVARMFAAQIYLDTAICAILQLQTFARRIGAIRYFNQLRRERSALAIQCCWRGFLAERNFMAAVWIARWGQRYHRGYKAREHCAFLLLEHVVTLVQKCWRRYRAVCVWHYTYWLIVRLQSLYRARKARLELKELKLAARDLDAVAAERDRFREEALRLRRELEEKEALNTPEKTNGQKAAKTSPEVVRLKQEIDSLQTELRKAKFTHSRDDEIRSLAAESAEKDAELASLRKELAALRSPGERPQIPKKLTFASSVQDSPGRTTPSHDLSRSPMGNKLSLLTSRSPDDRSRSPTSKRLVPLLAQNRSTSPARPERPKPIMIPSLAESPKAITSPALSERSATSVDSSGNGGCVRAAASLSLLDTVNSDDMGIMNISPLIKHTGRTPSFMESCTTPTVDPSVVASDADDKPPLTETLMFRNAVREGNADVVEKLLKESKWSDLLVNECDQSGQTPLHMAVLASKWKVVGVLLGNDAVSNAQDLAGNTPLHVATSGPMMALLLDEGRANPNIPNMDGECALHIAVRGLEEQAVVVLLQHRADVNCADNTRWYTPLHLIAQADLDERAHLDMPREEFEDEKRKRVKVASLLCNAHDPSEPDINYQDWEGNTPLHHVVMLSSEPACDILTLFLEKGANPKLANNRGQTPLHLFCHNDSLRKLDVFQEMLHDMLFHGADPNQTTLTGCTALHLSLYHRDVDSAIQLVHSGAELHLLWRKPKRWKSFWDDMGTTDILALDMVEDEHTLHRLLAAITQPQKWAPSRSWCMHCKTVLGPFARALHCRHCGRVVCGACTQRSLPAEFFPKSFEIYEASWVCVVCEKILVSRKEDNSSATQPTMSTQEDDDDRISF